MGDTGKPLVCPLSILIALEISDRFYNGRGRIIYPNVYYSQHLHEKCEKKE